MNGLVMISAANIKLERSIEEDVNELGKLVDEVKEETEKARKDNKGEEPKDRSEVGWIVLTESGV